MEAVIEVKSLSKIYKQITAVNNISFTVQRGRCFGLLGPNGAGKTTTIEMLEGIIPASSGEILFNGLAIDKNITEKIGIQFQHTALQEFLTVKETLDLFSSFYAETLNLDELIELCDLAEFLTRDTRLLSGGQKQRLLLALALVNNPNIIFLDEPTTGLDPQSRRNFWQLIKNIKSQGKTVILTTHYMDEAEQLCDDIVIMDHGKIIESGTPRALLQQHFSHVFIYIPLHHVAPSLIAQHQWEVVDDLVEIKTRQVEVTLALLIKEKIPLDELNVKSANLDDLFLKLTGHSLRG